MKYTVIGSAKSGLAAALLAKRKGNEVFLTESKPDSNFNDEISILNKNDIKFEFGGNTSTALNCDTIITSPGVLPDTWIIKEAEKNKIPIISELEYASNFLDNKIIAITGTNGKTTTTTLTTFMLNKCGKKAVSAGNIGTPLSSLVDEVDKDVILVVEVSSFQLDRIVNFRPDIAMILNITPDHLYYHKTFESYAQAKWRICANQKAKDLLILNNDDINLTGGIDKTKGDVLFFSKSPIEKGIFLRDDKLVLRYPDINNEEVLMLTAELRLPGIHNIYNSMAATLAARAFEIKNENIRDCLMAFEGVEHRLEYVRTIDGIDFINDSKATNVNASWFALSSFKQPIIWIAGGRGDSNDYSQLDELVSKNVKCIVTIGEESDNIFNHYCTLKRCVKANSLEEAVLTSKSFARKGDVVLFTPACKSFDMFMNYEHRGDTFKEIVGSI